MLYRLSKNTFVRQFGPFTYVLGRIKSFDQTFTDAEVFFRWITREPRDKMPIPPRSPAISTISSRR